jgi:hypothetical protein
VCGKAFKYSSNRGQHARKCKKQASQMWTVPCGQVAVLDA